MSHTKDYYCGYPSKRVIADITFKNTFLTSYTAYCHKAKKDTDSIYINIDIT